ncbi:hypothetical protein BDV12DRAFT_201472 [Aspergillus spectabilis]
MSSTKLIVVLGATGNQGGSIINTFLSDNTWRVRGVTRDISSASAQALSKRGVEMVKANLASPASLEAAFQGAHVIFSVTDFSNNFANPELQAKKRPGQAMNEFTYHYELQQGKNVFNN